MKALIILLILVSASPAFPMAARSKDQRIAQGVYGSSTAIQNGRIDVADSLLTETKKLIVPPKKPLKIPAVKGAVILPESLAGNVVRVNSTEYKALLSDRKSLKAYEQGEKTWKKYSGDVETTLRDQAQEQQRIKNDLQKAEKKIQGLKFYRNIVWGVGLGVGGLIVFYLLSLFGRLGIAIFR